MRSLDAPPSVDEFKFRMGYEAKPVCQRTAFARCLSPFVNSFSHGLLKAAHSLAPEHRWLSKAEGMFRLALNKNRADTKLIARQPKPESVPLSQQQ
jgi:hypothetical protein